MSTTDLAAHSPLMVSVCQSGICLSIEESGAPAGCLLVCVALSAVSNVSRTFVDHADAKSYQRVCLI